MSAFSKGRPKVHIFLRSSRRGTLEPSIEAVLIANFLLNAIIVGFFTISRELGSALATIGV